MKEKEWIHEIFGKPEKKTEIFSWFISREHRLQTDFWSCM